MGFELPATFCMLHAFVPSSPSPATAGSKTLSSGSLIASSNGSAPSPAAESWYRFPDALAYHNIHPHQVWARAQQLEIARTQAQTLEINSASATGVAEGEKAATSEVVAVGENKQQTPLLSGHSATTTNAAPIAPACSPTSSSAAVPSFALPALSFHVHDSVRTQREAEEYAATLALLGIHFAALAAAAASSTAGASSSHSHGTSSASASASSSAAAAALPSSLLFPTFASSSSSSASSSSGHVSSTLVAVPYQTLLPPPFRQLWGELALIRRRVAKARKRYFEIERVRPVLDVCEVLLLAARLAAKNSILAAPAVALTSLSSSAGTGATPTVADASKSSSSSTSVVPASTSQSGAATAATSVAASGSVSDPFAALRKRGLRARQDYAWLRQTRAFQAMERERQQLPVWQFKKMIQHTLRTHFVTIVTGNPEPRFNK